MLDLKGYGPTIFEGAVLTIELALLSLLVAFLLGLIGASAKLSKRRAPRYVATAYTTLIRGVPDLVLMFLIYYGGLNGMNALTDWLYETSNGEIDWVITFNEFAAGVITIGVIYGAYMTETFRGAFMSVEEGQIEAGKAYGMTSRQIFMRIMFPQMMRHALPGLGNNWLVLLKTTALVSVIGLSDMVKIATDAAKSVGEPFLFFIPVALVYLGLTALSEWLFSKLNARYSVGVAGAK